MQRVWLRRAKFQKMMKKAGDCNGMHLQKLEVYEQINHLLDRRMVKIQEINEMTDWQTHSYTYMTASVKRINLRQEQSI